MNQLYQDMKDAMVFFGLRFHDMHLVTVRIVGSVLVLEYEGKKVELSYEAD